MCYQCFKRASCSVIFFQFIKTHLTIYKILMCKKYASTEVLSFSKKLIYKGMEESQDKRV